MNRADRVMIEKEIAKLEGEKLRRILRAGAMGNLGFGEWVDVEFSFFRKGQEREKKIIPVPRLALHISDGFRITCGNEILMGRKDMFSPSEKIAGQDDFDWDTFDWDIQGNNRYDEFAAEKLGVNPEGFTVKKVTVNLLGDLNIEFENGFLLKTFTGSSGNVEAWRFFDYNAGEEVHHLEVCGQGLVEYDEEGMPL